MKKSYLIVVLSLLCCLITQLYSWKPSPETTFFAFDIDEVLVEPTYFFKANLVLGGMWYYPSNSHNWLAALYTTKDAYTKDADGKRALYDENGNHINGLAFNFLYLGMKDARMIPYASWAVKAIESSRQPINGMPELCHYLKNKGYTIVFATNKDHVSYDLLAKTGGKSLTVIPEKVFVAHPGNNDTVLQKIQLFTLQENTNEEYKQLAHAALTIEPSEQITHIPYTKPNPLYYKDVYTNVENFTHKKNMIFIDDKKSNIDGVMAFKKNNLVNAYGILFKNPYQLTQALMKLGVFSLTKDKEFLEKMKHYK